MNPQNKKELDFLREVEQETKRFLERLKILKKELQIADHTVFSSKHRAAAKRASLDLSRKLTDFRRYPYSEAIQ